MLVLDVFVRNSSHTIFVGKILIVQTSSIETTKASCDLFSLNIYIYLNALDVSALPRNM